MHSQTLLFNLVTFYYCFANPKGIIARVSVSLLKYMHIAHKCDWKCDTVTFKTQTDYTWYLLLFDTADYQNQ